MMSLSRSTALCLALTTVMAIAACDKSDSDSSGTPIALPDVTPAPSLNRTAVPTAPTGSTATPVTMTPASGASLDGETLNLDGLAFTVPSEWTQDPTPTTPMAPKAVFSFPGSSDSGDRASVRITHYPSMKGKDEPNIDRWIGQSRKNDGSAMTRDDVTIVRSEIGAVKLTTVDISGAIQATMRTAPKPGSRMIAAIVDHPKGPHFVTVVADEKTIADAKKTIDTFLGSAKLR